MSNFLIVGFSRLPFFMLLILCDKAVAKLTMLSSVTPDSQDISYIPSKSEKSIILVRKAIID